MKDGVITVVDHRPETLTSLRATGCQTIVMDAISFLVDRADLISPDDWIVPAVPLNVAYVWLKTAFGPDSEFKAIKVPDSIRSQIPNPIWGDSGQVYTSIATFRCPEDCREPKNLCTYTQKARPQTLWLTLTDLNLPGFRSICIRSHQLATGVGGYAYKSLLEAQDVIKANPGKYLLSTACKCHGIINAFAS